MLREYPQAMIDAETWMCWFYDNPDQSVASEHEALMWELGERAGTTAWMPDTGWLLLHGGDIDSVFAAVLGDTDEQ